jgi:uncharacterized membrane protein YdfJ with MMPL/SSD domain
VQAANGGGFSAAITGDHSVGADFGTVSQTDLEHGEFAIGLPAALVVLVLVFASVDGGLVPVLMALLSILVGLGIVALLSLEFSLSIFIVNMLTGMGLALGIDYSLFVVSRYREERGLARRGRDRDRRRNRQSRRPVQRQYLRRRLRRPRRRDGARPLRARLSCRQVVPPAPQLGAP